MRVSQPFVFKDNYRIEATREELYSMQQAILQILSRNTHGLNWQWAQEGTQGEVTSKIGTSEIQLMLAEPEENPDATEHCL